MKNDIKPPTQPLSNYLFRFCEQALQNKVENRKAAFIGMLQITQHYKNRGGNIKGYKKTILMLLDEFWSGTLQEV